MLCQLGPTVNSPHVQQLLNDGGLVSSMDDNDGNSAHNCLQMSAFVTSYASIEPLQHFAEIMSAV